MGSFFESDLGGVVLAIIAIYIAWWLYKHVFSSGGSSGGLNQYPYEYMGKRFKTKREMEQYKNDYIESIRQNDPRWHI